MPATLLKIVPGRRRAAGPSRHRRPQQHRVLVGAQVRLHADRADRQRHAPPARAPARPPRRPARSRRAPRGPPDRRAQQPHAQARARGTGGARACRAGSPSIAPSSRTSTLYRSASGSTTLPCGDHLLDDRHAVVVGLDGVGALGAAGLDGVGVDGALARAGGPSMPRRRASRSKTCDEGVADGAALGLGLDQPLERAPGTCRSRPRSAGCARGRARGACRAPARLSSLRISPLSMCSSCRRSGPSGLAEQHRRHRRVDAARGQQEHRAVPDLVADPSPAAPRRNCSMVQVGRQPQISSTKLAIMRVAVRRCRRPRGGTGSRSGAARSEPMAA